LIFITSIFLFISYALQSASSLDYLKRINETRKFMVKYFDEKLDELSYLFVLGSFQWNIA